MAQAPPDAEYAGTGVGGPGRPGTRCTRPGGRKVGGPEAERDEVQPPTLAVLPRAMEAHRWGLNSLPTHLLEWEEMVRKRESLR